MGEDAQAVDGSCLSPEDDGTESDGATASGFGEGDLSGCEVAFRADQDEDAAKLLPEEDRSVGGNVL